MNISGLIEELLPLQKQLTEYIIKTKSLSMPSRTLIISTIIAMLDEINETKYEMNNYFMDEIPVETLYEELIDILHFVIQLGILVSHDFTKQDDIITPDVDLDYSVFEHSLKTEIIIPETIYIHGFDKQYADSLFNKLYQSLSAILKYIKWKYWKTEWSDSTFIKNHIEIFKILVDVVYIILKLIKVLIIIEETNQIGNVKNTLYHDERVFHITRDIYRFKWEKNLERQTNGY